MDMSSELDIIEYSEMFKALGHPTRLKIAYNLMCKPSCNVSKMCECLKIPQPTVSQHLTILKNAKIITGYKSANQVCYKVENQKVIDILKQLV